MPPPPMSLPMSFMLGYCTVKAASSGGVERVRITGME